MRRYVVIDIGGTSLRSALIEAGSAALLDVQRSPVVSFLTRPGAGAGELVDAVVAQIAEHVQARAAAAGGLGAIDGVGIAFPGPVSARGEAHSAPTLWGPGVHAVPLRAILARRLALPSAVPLAVMNDISAAAYRYAEQFAEDFAIFTISSGIGNKVMAGGRLLLNAAGLGGELGHHQVVASDDDDALACDCGGRGHLGAVASGRGAERLAQRWAARDPARYAASQLARQSGGDPSAITTYHLVEAIRGGDPLASAVLRFGQAHLARCMALLYAAIGVKRFVVIGGFCVALGELYAERLREELAVCDLFGIEAPERGELIRLGALDDDHGLCGLGAYLDRPA
jgi:glucokinase